MKCAVIIPARYQSTRLPGKPLIDLDGLPMVVRTYNQCVKACSPENVYVATDDNRIKDVCESFDIKVVMTSPDCKTGTDRVAECAEKIDADVFINVQGDEPVIDPEDIVKFIVETKKYPLDVLNGYCRISDEEQFRNFNIPKLVKRRDGRLLYMSRSCIPTTKKNEYISAWRQVCIYSFPKKALRDFRGCDCKTELEQVEDIEILRFLEIGYDVRMIELSESSIAVDTEGDISRVLNEIRRRGL